MPAQVEEIVLEVFRLDSDSLRDLDAILRDRCREIDPDIPVRYQVRRRDGLRYETQDVEDVVRERNGRQTALLAVTVVAEKGPEFRCRLSFEKSLSITIEGEDRARVVLLASDVRNLARERMRLRGFPWRVGMKKIAVAVGLCVLALGATLVIVADSIILRHNNALLTKYEKTYGAATDAYEAQQKAASDRIFAEANSLQRAGSMTEKLNFLVANVARQAEDSVRGDQPNVPDYPNLEDVPAWEVLAIPLLALAVGSVAYWTMRYLWPKGDSSLFLIGDEMQEFASRQKKRERVVWGVGVALALGIASSIIASWIQ